MKKLDHRTYMILLAVSTVCWFFFDRSLQIHLTVLLHAFLLVFMGEKKKAVKFVVLYTAMVLAASFFASRIALMYIILNMSARSIPLVMMVACIAAGNASELMASLQKWNIPKAIIVMIGIMIRFFPVLSREIVFIKDGMKARRVFCGWRDGLRHPFLTYECFMIPLIVRCLKLSDELGAAAELRGLNADRKRTCIYEIGFGVQDMWTLIGYGAAMGWICVKG